MYLIIGLGNPGREYQNTRHNAGFGVIDVIAEENGIAVREAKHRALLGKGIIDGQKVLLAKPQTFMNLSGESVGELLGYYKEDAQTRLMVIYDDIALPPGQIRIRTKGSAGGHNGMKNIIAHLGHDTFARIRVGVGEKPPAFDLADYVLGRPAPQESLLLREGQEQAAQAVRLWLRGETAQAMNRYNRKNRPDDQQSEKQGSDKGADA